jgi:hypothetical protein
MSKPKRFDRASEVQADGCLMAVLWLHKGCKQWVKKVNGRMHYFGTDYDIAVKRYEAWLANQEEVERHKSLKDYLNVWLSTEAKRMSFDARYASYWEARRYIEDSENPRHKMTQTWVEWHQEKMQLWDFKCRVYVITSEGSELIKIGSSSNTKRRLSDLQTGSAENLRIKLNLPGGRRHEIQLHEEFQMSRIRKRSEWFSISEQIADWIRHINLLK